MPHIGPYLIVLALAAADLYLVHRIRQQADRIVDRLRREKFTKVDELRDLEHLVWAEGLWIDEVTEALTTRGGMVPARPAHVLQLDALRAHHEAGMARLLHAIHEAEDEGE